MKQKRRFWKLVLVLPDVEEQTPESPGRSAVSCMGSVDTDPEEDCAIESGRQAGRMFVGVDTKGLCLSVLCSYVFGFLSFFHVLGIIPCKSKSSKIEDYLNLCMVWCPD